jgi:hypothetical protein
MVSAQEQSLPSTESGFKFGAHEGTYAASDDIYCRCCCCHCCCVHVNAGLMAFGTMAMQSVENTQKSNQRRQVPQGRCPTSSLMTQCQFCRRRFLLLRQRQQNRSTLFSTLAAGVATRDKAAGHRKRLLCVMRNSWFLK